jgi:hypothetical protein
MKVRLGEWNTATEEDCDDSFIDEEVCSDKPLDIMVETAIRHPEYNARSKKNDIALLRLEENVNYTMFIKPICLPTEFVTQNANLNGVSLLVAGIFEYKFIFNCTKKFTYFKVGERLRRHFQATKSLKLKFLYSREMIAKRNTEASYCQKTHLALPSMTTKYDNKTYDIFLLSFIFLDLCWWSKRQGCMVRI